MQRRTFLPALLSAFLLAGSAALRAQDKELEFGVISTESSMSLRSSWQPLLDDLRAATGLRVNAFFASDYTGVIEAMRFGKVQLAWLGNKSAVEAVDRSAAEVFAHVVELDGSGGYWSVLVVHRDSPLKSLDDVIARHADLTLAMGDVHSTSGSLAPSFYAFESHHVDPARGFKHMVRADHESNVLAVANHHVDVAAVSSDSVLRLKETNPAKWAELREVWRSPLIPSDPLVWRKDLEPGVKKRLLDFLLGYGKNEHERKVLEVLQARGFVASTDRQLIVTRQLMLAQQRHELAQDASLPGEEKARRLKEIGSRMDDLARQASAP